MELKNISKHRPSGMVVDVSEEDVEDILETKEFIRIGAVVVKEVEVDEEKPNTSWTEKEIDAWCEEHAPHLDYRPTRHTKKYILDKLTEEGLI